MCVRQSAWELVCIRSFCQALRSNDKIICIEKLYIKEKIYIIEKMNFIRKDWDRFAV